MKKVVLSLILWLVVLSCACEMPTESVNDYSRVVKFNFFNSSDQLTSYENLEYDASGLFVRIDTYVTNTSQNIGLLSYYHTLEYDSANRPIRQNEFDGNSNLLSYVSYVIDDATGRATRTEFYNSNEEMTGYDTVEYSDNNTKKVVIHYAANGVANSSNIIELDPSNILIEIKEEGCFRLGCSLSLDYEYASNRMIRRNQYFATGSLSSYRTYKYDSTNRLERVDNFSFFSNFTGYSTVEYERFSSTLDFNQFRSRFSVRYWYDL